VTETKPAVGFEAVRAAVKHFESIQVMYREYGALDTEPDGVFQRILWDVINDKDTSIPMSGDGWELYASSMDCTKAADALHLAAVGAVQAIFACRISDRRTVREYLKDYCWRCN
jgi:hypothetical protein